MGTIGRREAVMAGFQVVKESSSQWHALVQTLAVENGLVINFIVTSPCSFFTSTPCFGFADRNAIF